MENNQNTYYQPELDFSAPATPEVVPEPEHINPVVLSAARLAVQAAHDVANRSNFEPLGSKNPKIAQNDSDEAYWKSLDKKSK